MTPAVFASAAQAIGLLDLAQDLGLAHDHRVQACGHPEQVAHGLVVGVDVQGAFELRDGDFVEIGNEGLGVGDGRSRVVRHQEQLHAVAGGVEQGLVDVGPAAQGLGGGRRLIL